MMKEKIKFKLSGIDSENKAIEEFKIDIININRIDSTMPVSRNFRCQR